MYCVDVGVCVCVCERRHCVDVSAPACVKAYSFSPRDNVHVPPSTFAAFLEFDVTLFFFFFFFFFFFSVNGCLIHYLAFVTVLQAMC